MSPVITAKTTSAEMQVGTAQAQNLQAASSVRAWYLEIRVSSLPGHRVSPVLLQFEVCKPPVRPCRREPHNGCDGAKLRELIAPDFATALKDALHRGSACPASLSRWFAVV
jgi:hypothetical protein